MTTFYSSILLLKKEKVRFQNKLEIEKELLRYILFTRKIKKVDLIFHKDIFYKIHT